MHASLGAHTVFAIESKQLYFNSLRNTPKPDAFHEVIKDFFTSSLPQTQDCSRSAVCTRIAQILAQNLEII